MADGLRVVLDNRLHSSARRRHSRISSLRFWSMSCRAVVGDAILGQMFPGYGRHATHRELFLQIGSWRRAILPSGGFARLVVAAAEDHLNAQSPIVCGSPRDY